MFLTSKFAKFSIIFANFDVFSSSFREGGGKVYSLTERKKLRVRYMYRDEGNMGACTLYIVQKITVKGGGYGMNL